MGEGGKHCQKKEKWKEERIRETQEETLDPIMMDDDQIKQIMVIARKMRRRVPYQYKVNTKKRAVTTREGLASDEEEVDDLWDVDQIEEILCTTYERKTRGPRMGI
jgi:hypothetical protein